MIDIYRVSLDILNIVSMLLYVLTNIYIGKYLDEYNTIYKLKYPKITYTICFILVYIVWFMLVLGSCFILYWFIYLNTFASLSYPSQILRASSKQFVSNTSLCSEVI